MRFVVIVVVVIVVKGCRASVLRERVLEMHCTTV